MKVFCGNIEGLKDFHFVVVAFNPINSRNIVLTKHRERKWADRTARKMRDHTVCAVYSITDLELVAA